MFCHNQIEAINYWEDYHRYNLTTLKVFHLKNFETLFSQDIMSYGFPYINDTFHGHYLLI